MAELLSGAPVAARLCERLRAGVARLRERGVTPTVAIVRVGERPADVSYERGFAKRAQSLDIGVERILLPDTVGEEEPDPAFRCWRRSTKIPVSTAACCFVLCRSI